MAKRLVEQVKVIDTDTHVVEPYDLWTSRLSKKWGDAVPQVRFIEEEGADMWFTPGQPNMPVGIAGMAGWNKYPPDWPSTADEIPPELKDPESRLRRMDAEGIYAQVLYPNIIGFGGGRLAKSKDRQLGLECVQAYNNYLTEEWSSVSADRYLPMTVLPFWDIDLSIAEMQRCALMGHRGVIFSAYPEDFDQPLLGDKYWDRLWAAVQEARLPVNFHIGSGSGDALLAAIPGAGKHANFARIGSAAFIANTDVFLDLIFGGVCHRFPKLNFVSVESGVGYLPYLLESYDWQWKNSGVTQDNPEYDLLPSEYFRRQIYGCFWFERNSLVSGIEALGADNFMFETDYPHPTSMFPGPATSAVSPARYIDEVVGKFRVEDAHKLISGNATRLYMPSA